MKKLLFILFFFALSFSGFAQHQYTSYVTASGTNTYAVTVSVPTITNYSTKRIHLRFANANSGASTLNVTPVGASPLGAVAIRAWDGDSWEALTGGEIVTDQDYVVVYNGTYFELYPSIGGGSGEFTYSIQSISGTTHTIDAAAIGILNKWFIYTNASGCTVTVDDDVDIGRSVVGQRGPTAGTVTFVDNGTSVLISSSGDFDLEAVNRKASLTKQTSTDWDVTGELGPSSGGGTWGSITGTLSDQTDIQTALDAKQPLDADLTSIAGNTTGGFLTRTASNTYTARTITGTANEITVTNGDGVSGAPTIDIPTNPTLGGANITGVPISTGVSGLGTNVATWLATPSYTNFLAAVTGTSPYYSLSSGGTLTGVNTYTSNTANQHLFSGTWTATASNQYHASIAPTITARNQSGDVVGALNLSPSMTLANNSQTLAAINITPTFTNPAAYTTPVFAYLRAFDGTRNNHLLTNDMYEFRTANGALTITGPVAGPQIEASTGNLVIRNAGASGTLVFQISTDSYLSIQRTNSIGVTVNATSGVTSSTATQKSSNFFNWRMQEWTGSASQDNFWTSRATVSTTSNQTSTWDLGYGTSGSGPSLANLHLRIKHTGEVLFGASTSTTLQPNVTVDIVGGLANRQTTKSQITANQNDYAIGSGSSFRMSSDASRNVTGLTGGVDGKILIIRNVGSTDIVFTHEDTNSTAANRITSSTAANITVSGGHTIMLQYDATTSRWFDISLR